MKIIIPLAVQFGSQGGYRVLSELANNWLKQGHEVIFLVYKNYDKPYFPTQAKIVKYNAYGELVKNDVTTNDKNFLGTIQLRKALKKALDKLSADVVLATQCFTAAPVYKSKIQSKKFYYIQAYEPDFYDKKNIKDFIYRKIAKRSYLYPITKIVNSEMYFDYKEIKSDKVVYPGLDLDVFHQKKDKLLFKKKFIIGTIGRLEKIKGTSYILEAFEVLKKKYSNDIELHIAFGDKEWGNIEGVKFFNPKGDKELSDFYRSIDIYICASTFQLQAIHYPVIESMSCKTSLVTTGYYPSNENNSYIVKVKNSEEIVAAVQHIINNPDVAEQKAQIALKEVKQFDWNEVSVKMINYFRDEY